MALSPKQAAFVREYLVDRNATQAAVRAGYSAATARQQGCRLLTERHIQAAVAAATAEHGQRCAIDAERVTAMLLDDRALAHSSRQASAAVAATMALAKLHGLTGDERRGDDVPVEQRLADAQKRAEEARRRRAGNVVALPEAARA